VIETLQQLKDGFGIDYNRSKNLPSEKTRLDPNAKQILQGDVHGGRKVAAMVNLVLDVLKVVAEIILPGDPTFLLEVLSKQLGVMYTGDTNDKRVKTMEKIMQSLFLVCEKAPRQSKAFQTVRAVIVASGSQVNLENCFGDLGPPQFGSTARKTGKADYDSIKEGMDPTRKTRSHARVPNHVIEEAVMCMLSRPHVGALSYRTRPVKVPGTTNTLIIPNMTLKRTEEEVYRNYVREAKAQALVKAAAKGRVTCSTVSNVRLLQRTSFLKILNALTGGSEKMTRSVDYVTDILLNERIHVLQKSIMDMVAPAQKKDLTHSLVLVQNLCEVGGR
jgi:hypothetical protein